MMRNKNIIIRNYIFPFSFIFTIALTCGELAVLFLKIVCTDVPMIFKEREILITTILKKLKFVNMVVGYLRKKKKINKKLSKNEIGNFFALSNVPFIRSEMPAFRNLMELVFLKAKLNNSKGI
jgi:hypothetical protein